MRFFLLSFIFALALPLWAQDLPPWEATTEEVVVTGSRVPRPAAESPHRVTVIDSASIARSNDLAQLLNEAAGIVINGAYSNPGKDKSIFLRNGANQFTLILLDGQPLIDPSSLGGAVDLRLLSLENIERIEILRGARSLLYGSDAVAGVINLISRQNTAPDPLTLHLRAAAQSFGTYEGSLAASGATNKLDYRLGYEHFTTQGFSEALAPAGSTTEFDRDGATRRTLNAQLNYHPTPQLSIRPALRLASFTGDYDGGSFQDADNTYTNDLLLPSLAFDYRYRNNTLGGRYNLAATDRVFNDATFGPSAFRGTAHQGEVFHLWAPVDRVALTLGGQLRREVLRTENAAGTGATTVSPYLLLDLQLANRLNLETGLRYNHHSSFGGQGNWSGAFAFSGGPRWTYRLSAASAFQSPTLDQLFGPFLSNPNLDPQVSTSLEGSAQFATPDGRYRVGLTVFRRNIKDLILFTATGYTNQDRMRDWGMELDGQIRVTSHLSATANVSYLQGALISDDPAIPTVDEFFRRPQFTGAGQVVFTAKSPFLARLGMTYTAPRPDIWFDADFNSFLSTLDPFVLVNAYAEYQFLPARNLTLFAEVRNLTDAEFVEVTGFGTQGINFRGGVALRW
ncbi:TonB-dependent receptor [Neolewinella lacunae]|uniref:TonB-dependent receptor n=1 Tax=Neolewinella lacunae TaxID=1517758 RepID=A0A923PPY8_9BACT|nr:TonB-dependent receptor [Neolewinella lacunae]MBC6996726.1 TonB-dependent receptor [Neolewinella lacunae]MDN3633409.1 TonB-dependent receptor [Neolewinella lacunae]